MVVFSAMRWLGIAVCGFQLLWSCVLVSGSVGEGSRGISGLRRLALLGGVLLWPCHAAAFPTCPGVGWCMLLVVWMELIAASRVVRCLVDTMLPWLESLL